MSKVVKGARFISKITDVTGVEPTIPPNDDHTLGWKDTDIYVGEWFWNVTDAKIYFRDNYGISQLVTPNPSTGQIDPSLLPSNYLGAMVYRGIWDARTSGEGGSGQPPGISYGRLVPEKGDYYVVNIAGSQNLDGETDWEIGDYAVYNGTSWDKIDNSEPIIYANNVLYDNSTYTSLSNVDDALEKIFNEKFITPSFDTTVTIDDTTDTPGKTILQLKGNSTSKWINWDGSTLNIGSDTASDDDTILNLLPKDTPGTLSKSSTFNTYWKIGSGGADRLRWKIHAESGDGYIQGYANNGTTVNTKISSMGDSYFLVGNIGIGTVPSGSYKLDVNGDVNINGNVRANTHFYSMDSAVVLGVNSPGNVYLRPDNWNSSTDQSVFTTTLATIGTDTNISGDLSVDDNLGVSNNVSITGNTITYGALTVNSSINANTLGISGFLTVGSTSTFTGKASYNSTISITSVNDIPHKSYVDDEIAAHAVGWWKSGTTQDPTLKDVVVHSGTITYKVGINKLNPTYDLDVVGNALITSTLDVNGTLNANSSLNVSGDFVVDGGGYNFIKFIDDTAGSAIYEVAIGDIDAWDEGNYLSIYQGNLQYITSGGDSSPVVGYSVTSTLYDINMNTRIDGNLDLNGNIDVSNSVNLGSSATNEVVLRGNVVTIANSGDSDNFNLKFASASAFGNQIMGMASASPTTPRSLTIVGQDNTSIYTAGALTVRSGNAASGNGGALNLYGGDGKTSVGGTGGVTTIRGGNAYTGGNVIIRGGGVINGGNVNIFGGGGTTSAGDIILSGGVATSGPDGLIMSNSPHKISDYIYTERGSTTSSTALIIVDNAAIGDIYLINAIESSFSAAKSSYHISAIVKIYRNDYSGPNNVSIYVNTIVSNVLSISGVNATLNTIDIQLSGFASGSTTEWTVLKLN